MDINGGAARQLTDGDGESYGVFSADGRSVLFNSLTDGSLWQVPVEGGQPVLIISERALRVSPSHDGKNIAYIGRSSTGRTLVIRSFPEGKKIYESDVELWNASPYRIAWTPDGRSVIYPTTNKLKVGNLIEHPLDGSPPTQITDFASLQIFDFHISPSRQLTLVRGEWKYDAVLLKPGE
jgi:Tol biopolymer transport system component